MDRQNLEVLISDCASKFESGHSQRWTAAWRRLLASGVIASVLVYLVFRTGLDLTLVGFITVFLYGFALAFPFRNLDKARHTAIADFCRRLAQTRQMTFELKPRAEPAGLKWLGATNLSPQWDKFEFHHVFASRSEDHSFRFGHLKLVKNVTSSDRSSDTIQSYSTLFDGAFVEIANLRAAGEAAWLRDADHQARSARHDVWTRNPGADVSIQEAHLTAFGDLHDTAAPLLNALRNAPPEVGKMLAKASVIVLKDNTLNILVSGIAVSMAGLVGEFRSDPVRLSDEVLELEAGCASFCAVLSA